MSAPLLPAWFGVVVMVVVVVAILVLCDVLRPRK